MNLGPISEKGMGFYFRLNLYLADIQVKKLKAISKKTAYPVAELTRRAMDEYLEKQRRGKMIYANYCSNDYFSVRSFQGPLGLVFVINCRKKFFKAR